MKKLNLIVLSVVPALLIGCGSGSTEPSEAKLRQDLSKPPSLAGMRDAKAGKGAPPMGAKQGATPPGGAAPAPPSGN